LGNVLKLYKYYQIADRIKPGSAVLDIGCGGGGLGEALSGKDCNLVGWDLSPDRTQERGKFYDSLVKKDIEKEKFGQGKYDVIVLADVLEHLNTPETVLQKIKHLVNPGGSILVSLLNVAYIENRLGLLKGNWDLTDEGILDRTHIRFFTLTSAKMFLLEAGFEVNEIDSEVPTITSAWKSGIFSMLSKAWPGMFAIGGLFQCDVPEN
jgi:2-polyprenyl-3-methyl-5-hydroxy-6-metoxy-1,4-benzoquinol methylase